MADTLVAAIKDELPWPEDDPDKPEPRHKATTPIASTPAQAQQPTLITGQPAQAPRAQSVTFESIQQETPTPIRQETPAFESDISQPASQNYSREIANLAKIYWEDNRYSGSDDNFDYKFGIFINHCRKARIPHKAQGLAFDTILAGLA